ncbi:hypothetical protein [Luteolibacter sp. LG18]|uniref:hypothetical protein n=1 Tax=Luteolibacter sp. LG18 TaxID=2819286 RepID=UPI0030C763D5
MVQVTVEFIEVPHEEATRLLYKEKLGKDGDKLREALQGMVDAGKGKIVETLAGVGRSGQKATTESFRETTYPTEFAPPDGKAGEGKPGAFVPTSFETRNVGSTLEIEPTLGDDNKTVDLRFVPEVIFRAGSLDVVSPKDANGQEAAMKMPLFYSMRTNTSLSLWDGQSQLVGLLSPKGSNDETDMTRKVFVIVRADVIAVKAGKTK